MIHKNVLQMITLLILKKTEKCQNNYVPIYLCIKSIHHIFRLWYMIFQHKQSKRINNIIVVWSKNIFLKRYLSKYWKCPQNSILEYRNNWENVCFNDFFNEIHLFIITQIWFWTKKYTCIFLQKPLVSKIQIIWEMSK